MTPLSEIARVLRHREFRLFWFSQSASVIGDSIVLVALALFIVQLTGSATDLGLVLAASAVPLVAFLLVGGVWADRLARERVMITTDLACFVLHALLALLIFTGTVRIWHVVLIEMFFGAAEAFFRPAANGLLPQTVPEADVQQATAITGMSRNISEFAGPALATALVLGVGAGWAFALDSVTFLVSAACLAGIRVAPPDSAAGGTSATRDGQRPATVRSDIRDGYREVRSRVWVWGTLLAFCAGLFFCLAPLFVLGPIVAREQYGHIAVYGYVGAALGLGTVLGSLAGIGWRPHHPMRAAMLVVLMWPCAGVLYAAGITLAIVLPATVAAGVGLALFDTWWQTALAERIPADMLSRVTSYDWMVSLGLVPIGFVLAGPLASALGADNVLLGGSALAFVAFTAGLLPRETRMLERTQAPAESLGGVLEAP